MDMQSDFDRLLFFEHARKTAETAYATDPLDADARAFSSFPLVTRRQHMHSYALTYYLIEFIYVLAN